MTIDANTLEALRTEAAEASDGALIAAIDLYQGGDLDDLRDWHREEYEAVGSPDPATAIREALAHGE